MKLNTLFEGFSSRLRKAETDSSDMDSELSAHQSDYLINDISFEDSFDYMNKAMDIQLEKYPVLKKEKEKTDDGFEIYKNLNSNNEKYSYKLNLSVQHFDSKNYNSDENFISLNIEKYDNNDDLSDVTALIQLKQYPEDEYANGNIFRVYLKPNSTVSDFYPLINKYVIQPDSMIEGTFLCRSNRNLIDIICNITTMFMNDAVDVDDIRGK